MKRDRGTARVAVAERGAVAAPAAVVEGRDGPAGNGLVGGAGRGEGLSGQTCEFCGMENADTETRHTKYGITVTVCRDLWTCLERAGLGLPHRP